MSSLADLAVFHDLPPDALARLERGARHSEFHDGALIFAQDDPPDSVYAILAGPGHVRIGSMNRRAKMLMVETFGVGDIFGEVGVFDGRPRSADAIAEGRVQVLRIQAAAFTTVLESTPRFGANLARLLATRLRRTFTLLQDAAFERLEIRLARQLLYLAERGGQATPSGFRIAGRFRHSDLANLLGTTPRSVITILNAWRASGLVRYDAARGQITLANAGRLRHLLAEGTG